MEKVKVAIYCRLSNFADQQTLAELCATQKRGLLRKAEVSNFVVAEIYEDVGYEGNDMERPGLKKMLQDYADGKFAIVLVHDRSRLFMGNIDTMPHWPFAILSACPNPTSSYDY